MGVNTFSAAVHITPTVVKTLFKHVSRKSSKFAQGGAEEDVTDDILYDEAFNIVKSFIELGTLNTVESLQKFTNTHIISAPWASVSPVLIPLSSCNDAADLLINWFSPDELKHVVGGERWWQVRGLDGVDGEWVADKKMLSYDESVEERINAASAGGRKLSDDEVDILRMEPLQKALLYIHGGAYFWGSINTHRYQIIKYARKIKGKAFAVNYRKAPQYPWPCPLQDVLASYLYLIRPPSSALHKPIPSSKIVLAGDSAGGGLALSLLVLLRDLGLPMPAGAVLISPWVDLTHSFPSVMNNISTDIIPPHGFIHKPSVVWPIDLSNEHGRVTETKTTPPPKPGHADTLTPDKDRVQKSERGEDVTQAFNLSQEEMLKGNLDSRKEERDAILNEGQNFSEKSRDGPSSSNQRSDSSGSSLGDGGGSGYQPKPPKVLMEDASATPLELRSQIQLYATNEQLTHPLVSPILNGSLANLPPLYIIAGDHEALRDEIVYLAHRAAYPEKFPPRDEVVRESRRQMENVENFRTPTKVHLQVFDGMCHVLTVFTFHDAVKYAYRSIAEFVKHVTELPDQETQPPVFPELAKETEEHASKIMKGNDSGRSGISGLLNHKSDTSPLKSLTPDVSFPLSLHSQSRSAEELFEKSKADTKEQIQENVHANKIESRQRSETQDSDDSGGSVLEVDFSNVVMVRQRVDIHGHVRQMEAIEDIPCLQLHPNEVGLLREAPARRWQEGQELWDRKFKSVSKRVQKRRRKHEEEYLKMLERAKELGLMHVESRRSTGTDGSSTTAGIGIIQTERRWGPLDLKDEKPPLSAIAARRDTPDALALLRKTLYHTAPVTTRRLPKRKAKDVVKATFDPNDDPKAPPKQSSSEQQRGAEMGPVHGLKIWAYLMSYFGERSSRQAKKGTKKAASGAKKVGGKLRFSSMRSNRRPSSGSASEQGKS